MKKGLLILVGVIVLAVAGGVFYVFTNLDSIVKAAIEKYGSEAAQTTVRVESVDISLTEGRASIDGLTVANPEGFSSPNIFSLGGITVGLNLDSVGQQPLVINEINVRAPEVFYEINADNNDNISVLQHNIARNGKARQGRQPAPGDQTRLLIQRVRLKDVALHADVIPLERSYDVTLAAIEMNDLGAPDGASAPQIARQILNTLLARVKSQIRERGMDEVGRKLDGKKQELNTEADKELEKEKQQARKKLKELLE